jgi:ABC-type branched-subunit amino acid transport system substrate-binding protein
MFIGMSIQKVGAVDADKVGAEIYKTSYKGMSGTFGFDDKGNLKSAPITIYTFKAGAPTPLGSY